MSATGEWGEFFPINLSPFAYNETAANDQLPLSKEIVIASGLKWLDPVPVQNAEMPISEIEDSIAETKEDITTQILKCSSSQKNYKIIKSEFDFYKEHSLPIPRKCFNERFLDRMKKRSANFLYSRNCHNCSVQMYSSYPTSRPEKVFCEKCYLENVY
jgi:hypothetical protein